MGSSPFRCWTVFLVVAGSAAILAACDPGYTVGARQVLIGTPALSPKDMPAALAQADSATVRIDVPRVADCLEEALLASPAISDIRPWRETNRIYSAAGMSFLITDSSALGHRQHANLALEVLRREAPTLEVSFSWAGFAWSMPLEEQRQMVSIATELLSQLRAQCLPRASGPIECVAEGLGGRKACQTSQ